MPWLRKRKGEFECPVCERNVTAFDDHKLRREARCPHCGAMERHRAFWLYLNEVSDLRSRRGTVLHFAPEPPIAKRLATWPNLKYTTCDIEEGRADLRIDAQDIDLPDASVEVILCAHVLEHVPDDRLAMRELRRILVNDGWAVIQVPVLLDVTDEDPSVTDPAERLRRFAQEDHVRAYGKDYYDRLAEAGFVVEQVDLRDHYTADQLRTWGVHYKVADGDHVTEGDDSFFIPVCRAA